MTIKKGYAVYLLGWIKSIVDMGIQEDDQRTKDDVVEALDGILEYIGGKT